MSRRQSGLLVEAGRQAGDLFYIRSLSQGGCGRLNPFARSPECLVRFAWRVTNSTTSHATLLNLITCLSQDFDGFRAANLTNTLCAVQVYYNNTHMDGMPWKNPPRRMRHLSLPTNSGVGCNSTLSTSQQTTAFITHKISHTLSGLQFVFFASV